MISALDQNASGFSQSTSKWRSWMFRWTVCWFAPGVMGSVHDKHSTCWSYSVDILDSKFEKYGYGTIYVHALQHPPTGQPWVPQGNQAGVQWGLSRWEWDTCSQSKGQIQSEVKEQGQGEEQARCVGFVKVQHINWMCCFLWGLVWLHTWISEPQAGCQQFRTI